MVKRIITWHIPCPGAPLPAFYMERDYTPERVRIYAENAPMGNDCEVDIRDDGATIFENRTSPIETKNTVYSRISYNTLAVSTFKVGEIITGGTSGAKGKVVSDGFGNMALEIFHTTSFSVGETITGVTSLATAVILSFYRGGDSVTYSVGAAKTTAVLPKGANLEEHADDFSASTEIEEGSVLTCHEIEMGGASNVTVQLELESLDEEGEDTD